MKILWIAQKDLINDLDSATWLEMSKELGKRDHHIRLITSSTSRKQIPNNIPNVSIEELVVINHFPLISISFHLQVLFLTVIWIFSRQPEIVLTHPITSLFILPATALAKIFRLKVKFILDIRTLPISSVGITGKIKRYLNNFSIRIGKRWFSGITVITPALKQLFINKYQVDHNKISTWMSGVDVDLFQPKLQQVNNRKQNEEHFVVMYHGVLSQNRGLFELIHAMSYVKEKEPTICLFILGKGLVYNKLNNLVHQFNLEKNIYFLKPVPHKDIPGYIAKADVGILPLPDQWCWRVSSPLKLFEYLAMCKPVIVSPIEAHTSVLNNCSAGFFLKSTHPKDIAETIIRAFYYRYQLNHIGKKGRNLVVKEFTWSHQAEKLEKFLMNL